MIVGRAVGWVLVLLALAIMGWAAWQWAVTDGFAGMAAGEVWYRRSAQSLNTFQAVVQRYVDPALWDELIQPILLWPAPRALFAAAGVLLLLGLLIRTVFRRRRRSEFRRT